MYNIFVFCSGHYPGEQFHAHIAVILAASLDEAEATLRAEISDFYSHCYDAHTESFPNTSEAFRFASESCAVEREIYASICAFRFGNNHEVVAQVLALAA